MNGSPLYTIPAGTPFSEALAAGLMAQAKETDTPLTAFRVLLPTRRACRTLGETFLRLSGGKPLLLPRFQPLGDVEEEELVLELAGKETAAGILSLPPAIAPLRRRILLARVIAAIPDFSRGPDQDFLLAEALGRLMDRVHTEGLSLNDLETLVPEDKDFARHWQKVLKLLNILSQQWPAILAEQGVIDAAQRRVALIDSLSAHWQDNPPQTPVIAAGSTGSIPATARLLRVVSGLPQGCVVLPGLDLAMDEQSWAALDETHPQAMLRQLLERMDKKRADVRLWPHNPPERPEQAARRNLAGEAMRPAATAEHWQNLSPSGLERALDGMERFDCDTAQEEAKLVALILRETLETPGRTAALITPDRVLARRVAAVCRRWGIEIDDSGGRPLGDTALGGFLRLIPRTALEGFRPGVLAALLKHEFFRLGRTTMTLTRLVDRLEIEILRGPLTARDLDALKQQAVEDNPVAALLGEMEDAYAPFSALCAGQPHPFTAFLDAHIALAETLAQSQKKSGADALWQGEDGEAAALFLSGLRDQGDLLPAVTGYHYLSILEQLMRTEPVRPAYGTHPRLFILGQLEARLAAADVTILAGLNEGTWPPDPGNDPWMSRPMRRDFGLPTPERSVGLAAHDFVQGLCRPRIILTRSRRVDGTPTVPTRWLQRLDTVLEALGHGIIPAPSGGVDYLGWARALDRPDGPPAPVRRPEPRPPLEKRPDSLYVTAIERWMRDPYSLYARSILRLKKLPALEEKSDAAERGTLMHEVLDRFIRDWPDTLPPDAEDRLIALGRDMLGERLEEPRLWGFWWPRFERLAHWFVSHERQWRLIATPCATEREGRAVFDVDGTPFTLNAKADRIDSLKDGGFAVIDYKTGTVPTNTDIQHGYAPQLPLEALILLEGGFETIEGESVPYMGFWRMTGGAEPGQERLAQADIEQTRQGFLRLVRAFRDPQTPYYSLPRPHKAPPAIWQDYAHLARVQEWAALDDSEEAA